MDGLPSYHGCPLDSPNWLSLGREFHFANRARLGRDWIRRLGCISPGYHLGRASSRRQELAGIRVQMVVTEETLILGGSVSPQTAVWLGSPWLVAFPAEMSRRWMGGGELAVIRKKGSLVLK